MSCHVILLLVGVRHLPVLVFDNGFYLNCFYFNSRSILNKLSDLSLLQRENFDIIVISETWLNDSVSDALLSLGSAFNVFRSDRIDGFMGGGVAILARKGISFVESKSVAFTFLCELLFVDFMLDSCRFRLIAGYRRPATSVADSKKFFDQVSAWSAVGHSSILVGDFNVPLTSIHPIENSTCFFDEFLALTSFFLLVIEPTFSGHFLDLLLFNALIPTQL